MNINKLKHLFLAALTFVFFCSAIQCMQAPEKSDDFEVVIKRGYYDFLDRVGKEKALELGLEEPIERKIQGHEPIYEKFLNGRLIYKPDPKSDIGKIELRISDLANPLEGAFDLSRCGNIAQKLSISTGYRKGKKPQNANKIEIWIVPRFLVEKEINGSASHFKEIFPNYWPEKASIGIIWTKGNGDADTYAYLSILDPGELSKGYLPSNAILARNQMAQDQLSNCNSRRSIVLTASSLSKNMYLNFVS